jgi:hypothetical protein
MEVVVVAAAAAAAAVHLHHDQAAHLPIMSDAYIASERVLATES